MDAPLVQYTTTGDGFEIAYWRIGAGRTYVQLPVLPHSHVLMEWGIPEWRRGYELAARAFEVVRYDARGTGLSQREGASWSMECMLADLDAVLGVVGRGKAVLYAATNACPIALTYAVRRPERVAGLILWCPAVDTSIHKSNPMLEAARRIAETDWLSFSEMVAHGLLGWDEPDSARRYAALIREGIRQEDLLRLVGEMHEYNAWELLPRVQCPALILHRPASPLLPAGTAEAVAAAIPGARLALFAGASSAPYLGDWRPMVRTIAEFLGVDLEGRPGRERGRDLRLLAMKSEELTAREVEVVQGVARGLTNREIAVELVLAEKTVEHHVSRILVKLDLRTRTQIAAWAVQHGISEKTA